MAAPRTVSLLPSATEIVCALGREDALVGRSHECDFPSGVAALPAVSIAQIDSERLASAEIDAAVSEALERGERLYAVDAGTLTALRPELVITQTLCRVCAVEGDGVRSALRLSGIAADVVELEPESIDGVLATVTALGERLGASAQAAELVGELRDRLAAVERRVAGLARPSVFVAEWLDPPFTAGHWAPEMVALAGGREVLGRAREPSFRTTWADVRAAAPEVCVISPCGFGVARALAEAPRARVERVAGRHAGAGRRAGLRRRRERVPLAAGAAHRRGHGAARDAPPRSRSGARPALGAGCLITARGRPPARSARRTASPTARPPSAPRRRS